MRYFIWFLMVVGLIVLAFILIFRGFGGSKTAIKPLVDYANTSAVMQFTEHGPLVADQNYQGFRVMISSSTSEIQTLQGYNDTVVNTKIYPANSTGYAEFLRALDLAGFQKGDTSSSKADARGYCATGDRYQFEIVTPGGGDSENFWSSSCGSGNFGGNLNRVQKLFQNQIPDYDSIVNQVNL